MSVDVRVHGLHFGCGFVRSSACFIGNGRHEWTGLAGVGCIKSHCHVCLQLFTSFQPNLSSASHHYLHLFPAPASHLLIMCKDLAPVLISSSLHYIAQTRCRTFWQGAEHLEANRTDLPEVSNWFFLRYYGHGTLQAGHCWCSRRLEFQKWTASRQTFFYHH